MDDSTHNSTIKFVRHGRWTLEGHKFPVYATKSCQYDLCKKTIIIELYEVIDGDRMPCDEWISSLKNLCFTSYDSSAKPLYTIDFKNLSLVNDKSYFTYSLDPTIRTLVLDFTDYKKTVFAPFKYIFDKREKPF
jgi:hypothetical protein